VRVGKSDGLFERTAGGRFARVGRSTRAVRGITEDAEGRAWVTDPVTGFRRGDDEPPSSIGVEGDGVEVFHDSRSNLWVTTRGQGLWRVHQRPNTTPIVEIAKVETGFLSNGVWSVLEDRDGNIWIGTHEGLHRLAPHKLTPLVDLGLVRTVEVAGDGSIWAGTARELIRLPQDDLATPAARQHVHTADIRTLHRDRAGTLWAATARGLERLAGGRLVPMVLAPMLTEIQSIADAHGGTLWLADARHGLFRWDGARLTRAQVVPEHSRQQIVLLHTDSRDRLWIAFAGGRVGILDQAGDFRLLGEADGLDPETYTAIDAIAEDRKGRIWIGGEGGLTRFADGRFATLSAAGLSGRRIVEIGDDDLGYLWLATTRDTGIIRLHADEFDKAVRDRSHQIRYQELDTSHGTAGAPLTSTGRGVARGPDGRLFFVTGRGITVIDPHAIAREPRPVEPRARIEGAVVDDERLDARAGASLTAGTSRLRIDYTLVRLTPSPQTRFRYRLEGFDTDWVEAGTRRQAFYTNLAPRAYRFAVQAQSPDGAWSSDAATWEFSIEPKFYQTYAFLVVIGAGMALAGWTGWRVRVRKVRREVALVFAERMRLSRELHDTVLQNLASVAVQCGAISNTLEATAPSAHARLVGVRKQVEEYIRETRQSVWDLRSPMLETDDLAGALRRIGRRATEGGDVAFELTTRGRPRRYGDKLENEVLRIGAEAIQNAVRHARATNIRLELAFGRDQLRMRVSDDGCGLDLRYLMQDAAGHLGLQAMKERAAQIGGRLNIGTEDTHGTRVELVVPAPSNG
jgi:signal transduction histidine kinase